MESTGMRDSLAMERTLLANERTFLAYVRTSLSLLAGGAVLLQLFPTDLRAVTVGWFLVAAGAVVILVGIYRFVRVKRRLKISTRASASVP